MQPVSWWRSSRPRFWAAWWSSSSKSWMASPNWNHTVCSPWFSTEDLCNRHTANMWNIGFTTSQVLPKCCPHRTRNRLNSCTRLCFLSFHLYVFFFVSVSLKYKIFCHSFRNLLMLWLQGLEPYPACLGLMAGKQLGFHGSLRKSRIFCSFDLIHAEVSPCIPVCLSSKYGGWMNGVI